LLLLVAVGVSGNTAAQPRETDLEESLLVRDCPVRLEMRAGEQSSLRLRVEPACALSPGETTAALRTLLVRARAHADAASPRSFSIGRIVSLPWLSERLATAVLASPDWDAARGAPRAGGPNAFVARQIHDGVLHREIVDALASVGLRAGAVAVEKVLVGRAADDAAVARATSASGRTDARLPFDAILWIALESDVLERR
jgi:hypothetical protein